MSKFKSIWEVTQETAHPRARQLVNQSIIWDYGDEDSPLGSDIGADTFAAFLEFRNSDSGGLVRDFMRAQLASYGFSDSGWDLLDPMSLQRILRSGVGIEFLRRDDLIIGLAFAQLLLDGVLEPEIQRLAVIALQRQGIDLVLAFRGGGGRDARKQQLAGFLRTLETASIVNPELLSHEDTTTTMPKSFVCPVCGFPNLTEQPCHADGGASDEICPSCGFQFGYDDDDRGISFEKWREDWIKRGMPWSSKGVPRPPH